MDATGHSAFVAVTRLYKW